MPANSARDMAIDRLAKSMRMTTEEVLRPTGLLVPALGRAFDTVAWDELARIAMDDAGLVAVDPVLVAAVRAADEAETLSLGRDEDTRDPSAYAAKREAALDASGRLLDSILKQLEPAR